MAAGAIAVSGPKGSLIISPRQGFYSASLGDDTAPYLNPGEFSVVVRAIETVNKGRQSSLPRVLVNNNE